MINYEFRPLRYDDEVMEDGRCVGCRCELPSPLTLHGTGQVPQPSVIFPDSPDRDGNFQGLCAGCVVDLSGAVLVARELYAGHLRETYGIDTGERPVLCAKPDHHGRHTATPACIAPHQIAIPTGRN